MIIDIKHESGWRERSSINGNGQYHGKCLDWYDNGNKCAEIHYMNGNFHGKYFSWNKDGSKELEIDYMNGNFHGKYISWYDNGNKREEIDCLNGKKVRYDPNMVKNNR